jgi:hypothetical protein
MAGKKGYFGYLKQNDPDALREICSNGGKAAHAPKPGHPQGAAPTWTGGPDGTAAKAGRIGGSVRGKNNSGHRQRLRSA